ncbi:MAG: oleate hydratase, partial [Myxococcales bacterium]|nr:oleate hydratase [Myxococcales bacterium]
LSAAAFLIRDAAVAGKNIHILEERRLLGGAIEAFDGDANAKGDGASKVYWSMPGPWLSRRGSTALWDLLADIPTLDDSGPNVRDAIKRFNEDKPIEASARLIDANHQILDATRLGLSTRDRAELLRLMSMSERKIGALRVEDVFSQHLLDSTFWCLWQTTFGFTNWHSAAELRRSLLRFFHEVPGLATLSEFYRPALSLHDSIIRPLKAWLRDRGVVTEVGVPVIDAELTGDESKRHVQRLFVEREGQREVIEIGKDDYVLITLGSMMSDASLGTNDKAPQIIRDRRDQSWSLWENLARKSADFGRPSTFRGNVDQSMGEIFTLTMRTPVLLERIARFTGSATGAGGLITFRDSGWRMSLTVPHQPHFVGEPDALSTLSCQGLFLDANGDYVHKRMSDCTGLELLQELLGQFGFTDLFGELESQTEVASMILPYLSAPLQRRTPGERPPILPRGAQNFAFMGQFVELENDAAATIEYAVRTAMMAVYGLFDIQRAIPAIYKGTSNLKVAWSAVRDTFD